jgi:hypothetical protein
MTIAALRRLLDQVQPDVVRPPAPQLPPRKTHPRSKETYPVNAYNAVILSMNNDGYSDQQIADHLGIDVKEVTQIIDDDRAKKAAEGDAPVEQATETQAPAEQPDQAPEPPAEAIPELAELLAWAAAHDDQAVRADGETAAAVLATLRERRAVDAELEQITDEKTQLQKRLAELAAREDTLRPTKPARKKTKQRLDYDAAEVRAWARQNGHAVPDRGRIPAPVLDAWRKRPGARPLAAVS